MEGGDPALDRGTPGFLLCAVVLAAERPKNTTPAQVKRKHSSLQGARVNACGGAGSPAPRTGAHRRTRRTQTDTMAHFGTAEQEEKVDASMLRSMGFPEADVREALRRTKDDVNRALDLLTAATMPDEDAFDILATHPAAYDGGRRKPFKPARPDPDKGGFLEGTPIREENASLIVDSRLRRFREMGFSVDEAEAALKSHNNDVDAALTALLQRRRVHAPHPDATQDRRRAPTYGQGYYNDSPHDVLAEAAHPYPSAEHPRKRPEAPPNDPNKGGWHNNVPQNASVATIVDSRILTFTDMGFGADEAERALRDAGNDVDKALSALLASRAGA